MSVVNNFLGCPVMIQLKNPILGAVSTAPAEVEGVACGVAGLAFVDSGKPDVANTPFVIQVLCGSIEESDATHLQVSTLGADGKTPVRVCLELSNVANVTFCVEHHELVQKSSIITPN